MKILFPLRSLGLLLIVATALGASPTYEVEVKCEPKRFDVKRSGSKSTESAEESWGYLVTVTNHSFKEIPNLRVEYIVFYEHLQFGSKSDKPKPERRSGNKMPGNLLNNGKTTFETDPVTLKKSRLKGGWVYTNGAKRKAEDGLSGIWLRVYSGSDLIEEMAQPPTLKTQEKWEG